MRVPKWLPAAPLVLALGSYTPPTSWPAAAPATPDRIPAADASAAARAGNAFGLDLYARLRGGDANLCFSPLSLELALAMTAEGAAGQTRRQMDATLHLPERPDRAFASLIASLAAPDTARELAVANALWGAAGAGFRPEFLDRLRDSYAAPLERVDFRDARGASEAINQWVSRHTRGRIADLVSPDAIQPLDQLVLTNAVYFKGRWEHPFTATLTTDADFTRARGGPVRARFMTRTASHGYAEDPSAQALRLPYAGGTLDMIVLLPRRAAGIADFERGLTPAAIEGWWSRLAPRLVEVHLPRFRLETRYALEDVLRASMPDAFEAGRADFSGMNGRRDLFIGWIAHRASVEVNEQGTVAAAATGTGIRMSSARREPVKPIVFRADHPFVFLIRDRRTGAILFIGRLGNPSV